MTRSHWIRGTHLLGTALIALLPACAQRAWMMVPPKFDLHRYERIGVLDVACTNASLGEETTRRIQEQLLDAQPGSAVIALSGTGARAARGEPTIPADLGALAAQHGLDAVLVGSLELTEPKPTIGITSSLVQVNARTELVATLTSRLVEPSTGATVWLRTATERATVASGAINTHGEGSVAVADRQQVQRDLMNSLVSQVTHDFRAQYFKKRVEDIPPDYRVTYPDGVEVYVPPDAGDAQN
jgi:hypothetical protein